MNKSKPKTYGGRVPVAFYLAPEVFDQLENKRGKMSRNSYLNDLVTKAIKTGDV